MVGGCSLGRFSVLGYKDNVSIVIEGINYGGICIGIVYDTPNIQKVSYMIYSGVIVVG